MVPGWRGCVYPNSISLKARKCASGNQATPMEESTKTTTETTDLSGAIEVNDQNIRSHLSEMVRGTVEETLNAMLDADADRLCGAGRYERSPERRDTRAGSYRRKLQTQAGEVTLKMPKLRSLPFETQIIERYRRRESSVEEALIEMYVAGVSMRRIEDITEALWGARVSASTVSELNKKLYGRLEEWLARAGRLRAFFSAASLLPCGGGTWRDGGDDIAG